MSRKLRPGPGSLAGLRWLARVGPSPLDPWRLVMGWSEVAARSHARRLEDAGWLARYPMTRGDGSLFLATRAGVRVLGLPVRPAVAPAPTWWAHHCACAWTAAYLDLRERGYLGDRELIEDPGWSAQVAWTDGKGAHQAGHRPDLVGWTTDGEIIPIEVELAQKSAARLKGILRMYRQSRNQGNTSGVLYICGDQDGADRIVRAAEATMGPDRPGIGIRLLDDVRADAIARGEQRRTDGGDAPATITQADLPAMTTPVANVVKEPGR
jgi:hypothetical protein